jgi:hypothetical protein
MKLSKKSLKSSLFSGRKGVVVIQKTNLSRRKALASNMTAARAALKGKIRQSSPMSVTTPPSVTSVSSGTRSTSGMSSLTQESTRYKKHGVSFDDFREGNKDWRSFGSITYEGMKENGYVDILFLKGIKQVLEERGVPYSTAPGESGCQQAKVRQKANDERRRLLQDWETDREDHVKRLKFLTYPKQEDVILQSKKT